MSKRDVVEITIKGPTMISFALRQEIIALLDSLKVEVDVDRGITLDEKSVQGAILEFRNSGDRVDIRTRGR